jgi:hypothetical protein
MLLSQSVSTVQLGFLCGTSIESEIKPMHKLAINSQLSYSNLNVVCAVLVSIYFDLIAYPSICIGLYVKVHNNQ